MLKNYLIITARHLVRHKLFSLINIFCLAVGISFSLIIGIYILEQKQVNDNLRNIGQQYLVKSRWRQQNMGNDITTLGPLAKTMKDEYPALIKNYYRFDPVTNIVSVGDKHFRTEISAGDTTFVSMYGLPLLSGNPQKAFRNNQSAVVTEDFAMKFFGQKNVIDKVITIQTPADGQKHDFVITAVLKKQPLNSVTNFTGLPYEVYLPMDANQYFQGGDKGDNWSNVFIVSMVELGKRVTTDQLSGPTMRILEKYEPDFVKGNLEIELQPLKEFYLKNNNGAIEKMIRILSLVALFILVMAIINFVNINIGTSSYRLKEIGLRKVLGGGRRQLIFQFLAEAIVITFIAAILSLSFYEMLRPLFSQLLNAKLASFAEINFSNFVFFFALIAAIGLLAGIYPAFAMSSMAITSSVQGKTNTATGGLVLRRILLIIQFTLAIVVFISALNIARQINYVFHKSLGYSKEQVMIIASLPRQWDSVGIVKLESVKNQLKQISGVTNASLSYDIPDGNGGGNVNVYPGNDNSFISMSLFATDQDFGKVYNLHLKEGIFRDRDDDKQTSGKIVINETAARRLGWNSPVGKTIRLGGADGPQLTIAGVVDDFHFESLQFKVQPLIMASLDEPFTRAYRYFSVKLNTKDITRSIQAIRNKWKERFPDAGFDYTFMDDKFEALYKSELQLKKSSAIATALVLIIVFLGLFGVLSLTLTRRTKEIAVRKVLGADGRNIIILFIKDYSLVITLANIIAWPLAYILMNQWLRNYAYRMHQVVTPYLFVCGFVFLSSFLLITWICFKAANENPVKNLKTE